MKRILNSTFIISFRNDSEMAEYTFDASTIIVSKNSHSNGSYGALQLHLINIDRHLGYIDLIDRLSFILG